MTSQQLAEAQRMAREWVEKFEKRQKKKKKKKRKNNPHFTNTQTNLYKD